MSQYYSLLLIYQCNSIMCHSASFKFSFDFWILFPEISIRRKDHPSTRKTGKKLKMEIEPYQNEGCLEGCLFLKCNRQPSARTRIRHSNAARGDRFGHITISGQERSEYYVHRTLVRGC